ncbi:hypothetical protein ACQKOE_07480 [Novosphingobium sp. NPDC080210]|uniref:hypothetical protein n=1 Tax=Novosphingobium sp. NPDC080210 TaxID=3390596 RepID=UPI003CFDFA4F
MRIGFCGAHRSGKTTLAKIVAEEYGLNFVDSPASKIVKDFEFDMARDNRLDFHNGSLGDSNNTGVSMQWAIYLSLINAIDNNTWGGKSFVSDRTPLDVAAYMLADATAYAGEEWSQGEAMRMVQRAILDTERMFDMVLLVPPGIQFMVEDGKPPLNEAYQEHHHMLCRGMLFDEDLDLFWDEIRRTTHTIEDRMDFVHGMITEFGLDTTVKVAA